MLAGFKQFIMRGNVVDLAVGIVIGGAFATVITAFVDGLLTPLIAAVFGQPDLTAVGNFELNGAEFSIGLVLDALLKFLIVAAALYFFVVMPMNHLAERRARGQEPEPEPVPEPDVVLLTEIRDLLAGGGPQRRH
ncbi:large conductance mechanosensitive channel protein MscL [Isoptericola chiayiensis]|uniref:Large-conductance mechanosensitive channel n=1 Tax=Isoptericola chiayiensis TaxID=579446 RepID=A0ABP8Y3E5_9MICO|nr:large conductance mechanosensitive channel protein MscL [Isoptericola chiayiensis]NOV99488.1 large conductance mechanosensitive channel [Isoptericola chiayiensis]